MNSTLVLTLVLGLASQDATSPDDAPSSPAPSAPADDVPPTDDDAPATDDEGATGADASTSDDSAPPSDENTAAGAEEPKTPPTAPAGEPASGPDVAPDAMADEPPPAAPTDPAEGQAPLPPPPDKASPKGADPGGASPDKPDGGILADDDDHAGDHMNRDHGPTVAEQVEETVGAVVDAARPIETKHSFDVGVTVSAGAGACHLLIAPCGAGSGSFVGIPYISVGPGVGVSGQYQYRLGDSWRLSLSGDFSIGGFKEGSLLGQLGSYNGRLGLTFVWFDDALGFSLTSEPHMGLSSISLVPIPLAGVTHELSFSPLFWLDQQWVVWNINAALTTDLLVVVPYPSVSVSTLFMARVFGAFVGVEAAAGAEAKIGVLANSVGGSVGLRFVGGYAF